MSYLKKINLDDHNRAIEIADRVWWVGHFIEDDPFQCHVYLIEHGNQSVLFDPGSQLTFQHTLQKIEQVVPFSNIRYFVCHHQDPDICASLPLIDSMQVRRDAVLVSHWRAQTLLKHYELKMPFWLIEEHDWKLDIGDRVLEFIFTPYAHFPGAFCTFDGKTGTLFSSDIFGGFTKGFSLIAKDEGYFESIRPFHEHYMPSKEILIHAIEKLSEKPIKIIAPQHGSIIPDHLVEFMMNQLKALDCGLYLMAKDHTNISRLIKLNEILRDIGKTMILHRDFKDIADALLAIVQRMLSAHSMEFFAQIDDGNVLCLAPETRFKGSLLTQSPKELQGVFGLSREDWHKDHKFNFSIQHLNWPNSRSGPTLMIPLFSLVHKTVNAVTVIHLNQEVEVIQEIHEMIDQLIFVLQVALEREMIFRSVELERQKFYETSIRDPLTGLFTRVYMQESTKRIFALQDRDKSTVTGLVMMDIDHFKSINDTYGHSQGDKVLCSVASTLLKFVRTADIPVRVGGEEFAIFMTGSDPKIARNYAERVRSKIEELQFEEPMSEKTITASFGTALRHLNEPLTKFMQRADMELYKAKNSGRNRVC